MSNKIGNFLVVVGDTMVTACVAGLALWAIMPGTVSTVLASL